MSRNCKVDVFSSILQRELMNIILLSLSGVLGVENDIYMTGGRLNMGYARKEVFVYNTISKEFRTACPMNLARESHVMVLLEKIYVIGGFGLCGN